jgi:cytoskeletal protein CcmA (bactofilin family)
MSFFNKKPEYREPVTLDTVTTMAPPKLPEASPPSSKKLNSILRGSRLTGDILVTCDLELSGEILGNVTARDNSSICIKGNCRGSVETPGGNVQIEGEIIEGNITAGGDVHITGRFIGGTVLAGGKCYVDGEFLGRIEANDIEIGTNAQMKGEFSYREGLSIQKGAKVTGILNQSAPLPQSEVLEPSIVTLVKAAG